MELIQNKQPKDFIVFKKSEVFYLNNRQKYCSKCIIIIRVGKQSIRLEEENAYPKGPKKVCRSHPIEFSCKRKKINHNNV